MASTATYKCLCCRQTFTARTADRASDLYFPSHAEGEVQ